MKSIRTRVQISLVSCLVWCSLDAGINFANKRSGFTVRDGSHLNLAGATLEGGTLRAPISGGLYTSEPDNGVDNGAPIACSGVTIEYTNGTSIISSMIIDGTVNLTGAGDLGIFLDSNDSAQRIVLNHGSVPVDVVIVDSDSENPAVLSGTGSISGLVKISANNVLHMQWNTAFYGVLYADGGLATIVFDNDLSLAPTVGITASAYSILTRIYFNEYALHLGGYSLDEPTYVANMQEWHNPRIFLTGPVAVGTDDPISIKCTTDGVFNGQGNSLSFWSNSALDRRGNTIQLNNIVFNDVHDAAFTSTVDSGPNNGSWVLSDVTFNLYDASCVVTGAVTNETPGIFSGTTVWSGATITMQKNTGIAGAWTFEDNCILNGNGTIFDMNTATFILRDDITLVDITLNNVHSTSFDNDDATSHTLYLSNVLWNQSDGMFFINPLTPAHGAAQLTLTNDAQVGDILDTNVSWNNAIIDLSTDVVLNATWEFSGDTVLNGNGNRLDIQNGAFSVATGATVYIRNVVLDNVVTNSLLNNTGAINFSQVTIRLGAGDVDWSSRATNLIVDGPLYIITGDYTLTVPYGSGNGQSLLNGITAYYDTQSLIDNSNVIGFEGTGRLVFVNNNNEGPEIITTDRTYVTHTDHFSAGGGNVSSRTLEFNYAGTTEYDGMGHTVYLPNIPETLITVHAGTTVETTNVVFDGLLPEHLSIDGELCFGNGTIIRLQQDWTLEQALCFGASGAASELIILDLNGYSINMGHINAALIVHETTDGVKKLVICNGRIVKLSGQKLRVNDDSCLVLENVELALNDEVNGDYVIATPADIVINGTCTISASSDNSLNYQSVAGNIVVSSGATLRFLDGARYFHNTERMNVFSCADQTSTLEFIGATVQVAAGNMADIPLQLHRCTLIFDHTVVVDTGDGEGIEFGDNNTAPYNAILIIRPSATIHKYGSAPLLYHNVQGV